MPPAAPIASSSDGKTFASSNLLSALPGMEPEVQRELEEQGIGTISQLLEQTMTKESRADLAHKTTISIHQLKTLVGPARVYLGEHWATDVLGGYLFGGGWLGLGLGLYLPTGYATRYEQTSGDVEIRASFARNNCSKSLITFTPPVGRIMLSWPVQVSSGII